MIKKICIIYSIMLSLLIVSINTFANSNISIIKTIITDTQISAYINTEITDCKEMLGTTPCEIISYEQAENLPSDTLILVDTSGSIPKAVQDKTSEFLSELIDGKIENERYAIASFGTDITYLCDYTSDRYELSKAAEKLEYSEKYTYIYSTIDNVLKNIGEDVFTKIIVISDGVENNKDGITYDEILRTVSNTNCPIYTIGIENNNQENLKKFYSFSRNSAAEGFTLTSDTDISEVCGVVNECRNYTCLTIDIPDGLTDGSIKYLKISGENFECGIDIRMPVVEKINFDTIVSETVSETTSVQKEIAVSHKKVNFILIIGIAAAAIIISAIIIIIFKSIEKKDRLPENAEPVLEPSNIETIIEHKDENTILNDCAIKLTDINAPERSFRCALGNGIIIGRNANECMIVLDYDKYISRKHCRIFGQNGKIYIENFSPNKIIINEQTLLDNLHNNMQEAPSTGTRILIPKSDESAKEIFSGDIIRIGHTSFRFEII